MSGPCACGGGPAPAPSCLLIATIAPRGRVQRGAGSAMRGRCAWECALGWLHVVCAVPRRPSCSGVSSPGAGTVCFTQCGRGAACGGVH